MARYEEARYLYAIQEIPGDTAGEKFKWIEKLSSGERQASGDLDQGHLDQVPSELLPLVRTITAVKRKMHEDVAWGLKSEDQEIVNRAFQATWFFDGSHKHVVDDKYFREHIFPYVSLKTRTRIVKIFALALAGKDPNYARQIFTTVESLYGMQQALPLLIACDEDFAYETITNNNIQLSYRFAKQIFQRNPEVIVRYLRLMMSKIDDDCDPSIENIQTYAPLLPLLLKKRLETFVEFYEIYNESICPQIKLSKTRGAILLKRGTMYLIRKPLLYIKTLPLNKISETLIESMLPGLLPEQSNCDTETIMEYLKYYPEEKRAALLCKAYRDKYGSELLDVKRNVTHALMRVLPAEERIKQARIMIELDPRIQRNRYICEHSWVCYLPIKECISICKEKISKEPRQEGRSDLIWCMIYACKVSKDDDALLDTLLYFKSGHRNEEYLVFDRMMNKLIEIYDVPHLNEKIWAVLSDIIRICYVKHGRASERILGAMMHYKLLHSMSIIETVDMVLEIRDKQWYINFEYVLKEHPQYQRQFLVVCLDIIPKKYNTFSSERSNKLLYDIMHAMYVFTYRHQKSHPKVEPLMIKNYPWLTDAVRKAIWNISEGSYYYDRAKLMLRRYDLDLYNDWFLKPKNIIISDEDMTSGAALSILKQDPQHVLNNWQEYLKVCKRNYHSKKVQRFVRSTRWYKDIPIKFMEQCMLDAKKANELSSLAILAMLIRGESFTKILDPLIPKEVKITTDLSNSRKEYDLTSSLPFVMRLCNPPISLDLMGRLCEGDYLTVALRSLISLSRRSSLPKVISFAYNLFEQRVSVRKHGIGIMVMVASRRELIDFLLSAWQKNTHYSTRGVLLRKAHKLFVTEPNSDTWLLLSSMILSTTLQDEIWRLEFPRLAKSLPVSDTYAVKYVQLLFDMLDSLAVKVQEKEKYTALLLGQICSIYDLLPDEFTEKLLRRYLFHTDVSIAAIMETLTIKSYILPTKKNFATHMKIFADVFVSKVNSGWGVHHPKQKYCYPFNNTIQNFVDTIINKSLKSELTEGISKMLDVFLSVLTPQMDPRSYLLLTYAKQWNTSPVTWGYQLAGQIPELINIFSSSFIPLMAKILNQFLDRKNYQDYQKMKLDVMKGLVKAATTESCLMAVTMLSPDDSSIFDEITDDFQKMDHPVIKSILNNTLNGRAYAWYNEYK